MAYAHNILTEDQLGPGVWKVAKPEAPAQLKTMVAKGLAPLPARDMVVALYHFWCTNEPKLADIAAKTIPGLPATILDGALDDRTLPPGVLDFLGRKLLRNEDVLEKIVRHPNVHDETLSGLSRLAPESICDIIAANEQRWLAFPVIVESLYQNPHCRMSVIHRMLELAVRQGVEVHLPNMEEIKLALEEETGPDPDRDAVFRGVTRRQTNAQTAAIDRLAAAGVREEVDLEAAAAEHQDRDWENEEFDVEDLLSFEGDDLSLPMEAAEVTERPANEEPEVESSENRMFQIRNMSIMEKIRLALLGASFDRAVLIRDSNKSVSMSAIKSPKVKENEAVAMAANRSLSHDVIRYIASRRDWIKLYAVKLNLCMNPKTPMSRAMTFLAHLHSHDVKKIARSKNIPSALAKAAKRKLSAQR